MKTKSAFEQRLQCLEGTFAAENMTITPCTHSALKQLESGKANCQQLVAAAKQRHMRKQ